MLRAETLGTCQSSFPVNRSDRTVLDDGQSVHAEGNQMRSYLIVFVVATVAVFSTQAGAQQRGPSTPEERARAVQTAKSLQSDPLARNVQEDREWLEAVAQPSVRRS